MAGQVAIRSTWSSLWAPVEGKSSPEAYVGDNFMGPLKNTYNSSSNDSFRRSDHPGRAPGQVAVDILIFLNYPRTIIIIGFHKCLPRDYGPLRALVGSFRAKKWTLGLEIPGSNPCCFIY